MLTRCDIIEKAVKECLAELYSLVQPSVSWEAFKEENRIFKEKEAEYEALQEKPSYTEFVGPKPFEFYYLPKDIIEDVCDSYIYAYKLDEQQNLLDIIEILKNYCKKPIISKYIEGKKGEPGHRGYEHPYNLQLSIYRQSRDMFPEGNWEQFEEISKISQDKFFDFLDMAGNFFNWTRDLNSFQMSVYLGPSPSSNKEAVIENWKKYRNKDIEIDEEQIKQNYYGE